MAGFAWSEDELNVLWRMTQAGELLTKEVVAKRFPLRTAVSVRRMGLILNQHESVAAYLAVRKTATIKERPVSTQVPSASRDIERLLLDLQGSFQRKKAHHESKRNVVITMPDDGPYMAVAFGDPHAGDPGCDIQRLGELMAFCKETPRVHAFNVGDLTNNWVGNLSRLYAHQDTTQSEEFKLIEWLLTSTNWLFLIFGNHDIWTPASELLASKCGVNGVRHGGRFILRSGHYCTTIDCRHSHRGNSQYDAAFGAKKQMYRGNPADIIVSGHIHTSASGIISNGVAGVIGHTVRVGSFKKYDDYADANHFDHDDIGPAAFFVVRPYKDQPAKVSTFWDEESAMLMLDASVAEWEQMKLDESRQA